MAKRLILLMISLIAVVGIIIFLRASSRPGDTEKSSPASSLHFKLELKAPAIIVYQFTPPEYPKPSRQSLTDLLRDKTLPELSLDYSPGKVIIHTYAADTADLDRQEKQIEKRLTRTFGGVTRSKRELSPVTPQQVDKTRQLLSEYLNQLRQSLSLPFKYSLTTNPPATLMLQLTEIKDASKADLLRRYAVPPRGNIALYLLPDTYSLVKLPLKDHQIPQYLFLDKRRNQRQTSAAAVLAESRLMFRPEDLRPLPEVGTRPEQGKLELSVSYRFYPEASARYTRFVKGHLGRNLALVIEGEIIAAPKIIFRETGGRFGFFLSTAIPADSPEAEHFRLSFASRPLPLPIIVTEIKQTD
jgi:hypothetical protein